jgi:uncharacterized membrane protein YecN with MAPEG domain
MSTLALYAPLLALVFVALSVRTLLLRRKHQIGVGNGGNIHLSRAARAHANFAEYVPISLILIYLLEQSGGSGIRIHLVCIALVLGRVIHAFGISREPENIRLRVIGMALTFGVIISAALHLLLNWVVT